MTDVVDYEKAVGLLRAGAVVAVPTDTVYGLAASLAYPDAVDRLFRVKRRPTSVALPVLVKSVAAIGELNVDWPSLASQLSASFWPGALTLVVPVEYELAVRVGGVGTVGFRIPNDQALLGVLDACGPLAVSSANEHGEPPCRSANEVNLALGSNELLDAVLDGGTRDGDVSTVVEIVDDSWQVLRSGAISTAQIERVLSV
ncbi:MAG: L-threonylcarbamoyladenylate synthase [Acidimicrobiales bacterium]